jgi:hypothetical protein
MPTRRDIRVAKKRLLVELIDELEDGEQYESEAGIEATHQLIAEFRVRAGIALLEPAPGQEPLPGVGLWQIDFPEGFRNGQPAVVTEFRPTWRTDEH